MENPKQGADSAENSRNRHEQEQPLSNPSNQQKRTTGEDIDEGNHTIADLGELGMRGGHEGYSSGMKDETSRKRTES